MVSITNDITTNSVLIIEDDTAQLKTLADIIESEGYHPICCQSDNEAFKALQDNELNVAILDLRLGDVDGISVL